jgi:dipeptidase D
VDNDLRFAEDKVGNIVIYLPATKGYQDHETVIIQNHMDMVV